MKVVIAGGGTGGHLYPGIAIARELLREDGNEVLFVGTNQGIEARVLPKEGLPVRFIPVGKLKGMHFFSIVKTIAMLPLNFFQALDILHEVGPDIVLGVGGYASGPVGMAAFMLKIPLIIVEPNSYAGFANRKLAQLAKRVVLCYPGTSARKFFSAKKTVTLGPLTRKGIDQGDRTKTLRHFGLELGKFTVFVMGGSGGAHAINMAMMQASGYLQSIRDLQILHQTGDKDISVVTAGYQAAGIKAAVSQYIDDMAGAYAAADLVIARSGATSIAELAVCGKPAVLIPFPQAADNHQEHNARTLADRGSAEVILQKDLTAELLGKTIKKYAHKGVGNVIAAGMANTTAEQIVNICKSYVQKN
ncbi:MAG TPA: undecaprenyldiphospho-muramoylpentapeptide beta-N-acetylglucosaminyltransferase [Nitrospirota bacterium]|nr:undecaprenyldiphospho-muramoylpentapeptide beta-N-acetylglucosaminyltransferase [Nitrospirota bacterium]